MNIAPQQRDLETEQEMSKKQYKRTGKGRRKHSWKGLERTHTHSHAEIDMNKCNNEYALVHTAVTEKKNVILL